MIRYLFISLFLFFLHEPKKILVIGDSITKDGKYATYYREACKCDVDIIGYQSYTTNQILQEFKKIDLKEYHLVVIEMGINNVESPGRIISDMIVMADKLKKKGIKMGVLTLPPFKSYPTWNKEKQKSLVLVNEWIKDNKMEADYVIDIYKVLNSNDISVFSQDGLHPNEAGHKLIFGEMVKIIPY